MTPPVIVWYRQDLRLHDHPALAAAVATGAPVVPVYVLDEGAPWPPGGASRWWLHHSLAALDATLRTHGGSGLVLRRGAAADEIARLAEETGASAVFFTRRYEPGEGALERRVADLLGKRDVTARRFGGALLAEPETVATKDGRPYGVFTPFYRALLERLPEVDTLATPERIPSPDAMPPGDDLDAWGLLPTTPDWAGGLRESWTPGEAGATARLEAFLQEGVDDYGRRRDRPDLAGTSRLSPHLHFGEISPRTVWRAAAAHAKGRREADGTPTFLRQVAWREFCHHLLHARPEMPDEPLREEFARFPWHDDPGALAAWRKGMTGYPIVDAGMRELWATGWMHNRVRMIAASFLVKDLLIPWQAGEAWFRDTLVDADIANNSAGWQWVAGSGADAAPYFRVFNPVMQGEKFDEAGAYVRRWVPELAGLADATIHHPWDASEGELAVAGVVLGETYPKPIVDHAMARRRALDAFEEIKGG